ncbi:MAG: crotonase/enoyl-CoA hydratase family protein [Sphingobium sp.]|nr:crotonase/enoyl-CoA hydratase family protein [Sphingobium sp.]
MSDRVTINVEQGVADVRLARADKLNALDLAQFDAIIAAIARLEAMPGLRCVLLSGEGEAFCAGLDVTMFAAGAPFDLMPRTHGAANRIQQIAWGWHRLPVPVIAAVYGACFGAGFQMMMGADMRIAAPDARLAVMEARWGLVPDVAGIALFRGVLRDDVARELTYTGRTISGEEAARLGVVTRTADDPHAEGLALARTIAGNSPAAVRAGKRLLNLARDADDAAILLAESREQTALLAGPDHRETLMAAREKRRPVFSD